MAPAPVASTAGESGENVNTTGRVSPWSQSFTLYDSYGNPLAWDASLDDVNAWALYGIRAAIVWGFQIGASAIMVILLLALTKNDKRRSPIFVLNILALALSVVRAITNVTFYTSEWFDFYTYFAGDVSRVSTADYANSVTAGIMTLLLLVCVELSLILQASVVCATLARARHAAATAASAVVALAAVGPRVALAVWNTRFILGQTDGDVASLPPLANITSAFSICFFSLVFCAKLGLAIRNRHRLGLKQFGPMQIIFIMAAQTLIIPAVCSIVQFFTDDEIGALSLTLVAIFLPLSSVWASASTNDSGRASGGHDAHHRLLGSLRWRRRRPQQPRGGRKPVAALPGPASCSPGPLSPSSRTTTSTYGTDETRVSVDSRRPDINSNSNSNNNNNNNNIFDVGKALNTVFP